MAESIYEASLKYHKMGGRPGKIEVVPTKPCTTQRDLSLAYSPGVAEPCRVIAADPEAVYEYTNKGNLVGVITNGTAVLGLGDIGASAGKPVMEGKAVLFKRFANIDVFDIEINEKDPDKFIAAVEAIAPTFGGINLEDIKGPECFYIEQELERRLDIPVFHDDQHGTAIIATAALLNACEITNRNVSDMRCVFSGAGAAGVSTRNLFVKLGVKPENIIMCDRDGVIWDGRDDLDDPVKKAVAAHTNARTLAEAIKDADCFMGLSVGNVLSPDMLLTMAKDPLVFAMANPTPEIDYPLAMSTRSDCIVATGRSDYPNQVNNVLGFPFIFRGALDTYSRHINEEMKLAAVKALADLAKEPVPGNVSRAYGGDHFEFGREYLIPKPFDPRVLYWESVAVAEAAMRTGVARRNIDLDEYRERLQRLTDVGRSLVAVPLSAAKSKNARIAIPDPTSEQMHSVVRRAIGEQIAHPLIIGSREQYQSFVDELPAGSCTLIDPAHFEDSPKLVQAIRDHRSYETLSDEYCARELESPYKFAALLTEAGLADGMLACSDLPYSEIVRPVLKYLTRREGVSRVAGMHMIPLKDRPLFFADTTLIPDPSAEELVEIALRASRAVHRLNITPRVAFISYANFSKSDDADVSKLRRAYALLRRKKPDLEAYADVQMDAALDPERFREVFGDRLPKQPANILIFPNLHAANAAFRLARVLGSGVSLGPMLLGLKRPCNILPRGSSEDEIVDMLAITASNAHRRKLELSGRMPAVATPAGE